MSFFRPYVLSMYNTSNSIDVLSFDEVKFDVKSNLLENKKNTSNSIRRLVFSVISVYKAKFLSPTRLRTFYTVLWGAGSRELLPAAVPRWHYENI